MPLVCKPPSRGQLLADVDAFNFEQDKYQPHDMDGNGTIETLCNIAAREYLATRGVTVPPLLANDLVEQFYAAPAGVRLGWRELKHWGEAGDLAEQGHDVVGVYTAPPAPPPTEKNPKPKRKHGHTVIVVPAIGGVGLHSAQAGSHCWNNAPLEKAGLAVTAYRYFTRAPAPAVGDGGKTGG